MEKHIIFRQKRSRDFKVPLYRFNYFYFFSWPFSLPPFWSLLESFQKMGEIIKVRKNPEGQPKSYWLPTTPLQAYCPFPEVSPGKVLKPLTLLNTKFNHPPAAETDSKSPRSRRQGKSARARCPVRRSDRESGWFRCRRRRA